MKKSTIMLFLTAQAMFFTCSEDNSIPKSNISLHSPNVDLDSIQRRGYINAIIDNNSISYFIYKGQPMGYDYELLQLFAKEIGVELRLTVTQGIGNAFDKLEKGEGDIIALPLTVTKERKKIVSFTKPHFSSYQVLVQRKPDNWFKLTHDQINESLIRNPSALIGKQVHVLKGSSFVTRLENLSEEIGGDISIREDNGEGEIESLIKKVANGEIDYTVSDHVTAAVNAAYYKNLDVQTKISLPQQISWATRIQSPSLLEALNEWLAQIKRESTFMVIYNRYYKSPNSARVRMQSNYSSLGGNQLSPYDEYIKKGAEVLQWDWRLLAAMIYQESRFKVQDESWAGAKGLMQLMPVTARQFGVSDPTDPKQSIRAGVKYLRYLDKYWSKTIFNRDERLKFVLASYNAGLTHIIDAQMLTEKYGKDPTVWDSNVVEYLTKKSDPIYFKDPGVRAGYCRCTEPVHYVQSVLNRFEQYKVHISDSEDVQAPEEMLLAQN